MAAKFKVLDQSETSAPGPGGTFVPSMKITFETVPSGVTGSVVVPKSMYGVDEVERLITAEAEQIEAVQHL